MLWIVLFYEIIIMAGRGRGRGGKGAGTKALMEQLGLQKSELIKEPLTGPPETFPSLQFRPVKVSGDRTLDRSYMLVVKKELKEHLRNSEYNIVLDSKKPDIERYSDRFHCLNNKPSLAVAWDRFPRELRPRTAKPSTKGVKRKAKFGKEDELKKKKKKKLKEEVTDVKEKLEELEKKEETSTREEGEDEKEEEGEEGAPGVEGEIEGEDVDEEMDEGTDYINSYFDNGEDYLEEEGDALEEGGVF